MKRYTSRWIAAILILIPAIQIRGQAIEVAAVALSATHELLGDPLWGGSIGGRFPFLRSRSTVRLAIERVEGNAERIGVACAGLINPDTCHEETLTDDTRLTRVAGGFGFPVFARQRAGFALTGDFTFGKIRTVTRGQTSGGKLVASKALIGGLIGAEATIKPIVRFPLAVQFAGSIGGLMQARPENVADGYTPFNDSFPFRHARLGLAWNYR